jgi:hypoxanthine phosphoribosyltransferase
VLEPFVLIATVVSLVAGLIALYQFIEERRRKAISWRRVDKLVAELVEDIEHSSFCPDLILGVGRGGSLIAAMVATNLEGRIELACIDTAVEYDQAGRKHVQLRGPDRLPPLHGRHVLVVVAELYSGQDMRDAINFLDDQKPAELRTLAVLAGPSSNVRPTFVGLETRHEPLAPWRLTDAAKRGRI